MEFLTSYYRQRGAESVSLVLQQFAYGDEQACFICLCSDRAAGGYLTRQLLGWFRGLPIKRLLRQKGEAMVWLTGRLEKLVARTDEEIWASGLLERFATVSLGGILCVGEAYLLFYRGEIEGFLVQTMFGYGHLQGLWQESESETKQALGMKQVTGTKQTSDTNQVTSKWEKLKTQQGILQPEIGIIFTTANFFKEIPERILKESMYPGHLHTEEQMYAHLKGLAEYAGSEESGVVMVKSRMTKEAEWVDEKEKREDRKEKKQDRKEKKAAGEEKYVDKKEKKANINGTKLRGEAGFAREVSEEIAELLADRGYRDGRILGQGAFATVYYVEKQENGAGYACKVSRHPELLKHEFESLRQPTHPLFPKGVEFWEAAGSGFLVMEYVAGSTLAEHIRRRGRFSVRQTVCVGMELAEGLSHLQDGVSIKVFRDLKPENIVIRQDGKLKLLDFGCVCDMDEMVNSRAGSPGFGAPEQFKPGAVLGLASDVYALGRTLEAMLGGKAPGRRGRALKKVIASCTSQEPSRRLPDMRAVLAALTPLCEKRIRGKEIAKGLQFAKGAECCKNIWESNYKTLDV